MRNRYHVILSKTTELNTKYSITLFTFCVDSQGLDSTELQGDEYTDFNFSVSIGDSQLM